MDGVNVPATEGNVSSFFEDHKTTILVIVGIATLYFVYQSYQSSLNNAPNPNTGNGGQGLASSAYDADQAAELQASSLTAQEQEYCFLFNNASPQCPGYNGPTSSTTVPVNPITSAVPSGSACTVGTQSGVLTNGYCVPNGVDPNNGQPCTFLGVSGTYNAYGQCSPTLTVPTNPSPPTLVTSTENANAVPRTSINAQPTIIRTTATPFHDVVAPSAPTSSRKVVMV